MKQTDHLLKIQEVQSMMRFAAAWDFAREADLLSIAVSPPYICTSRVDDVINIIADVKPNVIIKDESSKKKWDATLTGSPVDCDLEGSAIIRMIANFYILHKKDGVNRSGK